jgi:hypothetical protein
MRSDVTCWGKGCAGVKAGAPIMGGEPTWGGMPYGGIPPWGMPICGCACCGYPPVHPGGPANKKICVKGRI